MSKASLIDLLISADKGSNDARASRRDTHIFFIKTSIVPSQSSHASEGALNYILGLKAKPVAVSIVRHSLGDRDLKMLKKTLQNRLSLEKLNQALEVLSNKWVFDFFNPKVSHAR
jgi:hypothetical protein